MDFVRQSFVERFHPSDTNISYLQYILNQNLEGRRQFFKWIRTKSRFQIDYTDIDNVSKVIESAYKFSEVSNSLITHLKLRISNEEYSKLVELIKEDDEQHYIDNYIRTGIISLPDGVNVSRIKSKLSSMGYKIL